MTIQKKQLEIELKVGLFVSIGVALIMIAILVLGSAKSIFSTRNHYTAHMVSADGLISGAKVLMSGINVGTIEALTFDGEKRDVQIQFTVDRKSSDWIRKDSSVEVATQGVLGDKFLSVVPGTPGAEVLKDGEDIPVHAGKDLSQFLTKSDQLLVSLNSVASSLSHILTSFDANNRSEIMFQGFTTTSKNLADASAKFKEEMDGVQIKSAIKNLNSILEKINTGSGTMGALINDPALYDSVKSLVGGANRNRVVRNLVRQAVEKGEQPDENSIQPTNNKK